MKIEIDYNGARAICRVDGKYIHECDALTRAQALSAFSCIEQHWRREALQEKEKRKLVDLGRRVCVPVERMEDGNYHIFYKNERQMYVVCGNGVTPADAREDFYSNLDYVRKEFKYAGRFFEEQSFKFVCEEFVGE